MTQNILRNFLLVMLVLSCGIGCDQTTKRIAEQTLDTTSYSFFFDTVRLQFIKNSGAFLGFGADFSPALKLILFLILPIVLLFSAFAFVVFTTRLQTLERILVSLMISGGVGNLIDRLFLGGLVTDFINVGIGSLRTGIFNIADVIIMTGACGLIVLELFKNKKMAHES